MPHPSPLVPGSPWFFGNRRVYSAGVTTPVADVPDEVLDSGLRKTIVKTVNGYGWELWFEAEPDGGVTGLLVDADTQEIIKSARGTDHEDVWITLGIDTLPPSQELREHREGTTP